MKKRMLLAAGLAASMLFSGCALNGAGTSTTANTSAAATTATNALATAQAAAQKFQTAVTLACNVVQPAIAPFAPFFVGNAPVTAFNADVALACGANAMLNLTSINNVIGSSAAAAQAVIPQFKSLTPQQIALVQGLIGAFQGSLKNAIAAYQASTGTSLSSSAAAAVPAASAPVAASATLQ